MNGSSEALDDGRNLAFEKIQMRLMDLEERKRQHRLEGGKGKEFLRFRIEGFHLAAELHNILHITRKFLFAPLYRTPDHVAGIFAHQGEILTLFHLDAILGLPKKDRPVMMVVEESGFHAGFLIDDVAGVGALRGEGEAGGEAPEGPPRYSGGVLRFDDGAAHLLDIPALLKSEFVVL